MDSWTATGQVWTCMDSEFLLNCLTIFCGCSVKFDVILGILKTQDARIRELEGIIKKLNKPKKLNLGPNVDDDWNYA